MRDWFTKRSNKSTKIVLIFTAAQHTNTTGTLVRNNSLSVLHIDSYEMHLSRLLGSQLHLPPYISEQKPETISCMYIGENPSNDPQSKYTGQVKERLESNISDCSDLHQWGWKEKLASEL